MIFHSYGLPEGSQISKTNGFMGTNDDFRLFLWRFTGVKQMCFFGVEIGISMESQRDFYGISTDSLNGN